MQEVVMQLRSIIAANNPKNKDWIRCKPLKDLGAFRIIFSLPSRLKGRLIDNNVLQKLRQDLNLTQDEILKIKTALESHDD
jgi:hypothetical protein